MSLITTYLNTKGLDSFPREKRFSIYLKAHKALLKLDPAYRSARNLFVFTIVLLLLIPMIPHIFSWFHLIPLASAGLLSAPISIIIVTLVCITSFREQGFRNVAIARYLKNTEQDA